MWVNIHIHTIGVAQDRFMGCLPLCWGMMGDVSIYEDEDDEDDDGDDVTTCICICTCMYREMGCRQHVWRHKLYINGKQQNDKQEKNDDDDE